MTTTTDNEATPAAAAVVYGLHGLRVVPVRGKVPPIKAWQDVATDGTTAIRELFARPGHATDGVSIVTGRESGVFVVDVDVANGKPGMESLDELERRIGPLPKGPVARTPSGGIHLYFATDGREIRNSAGNVLGPGLDVRGEGGQVVAPPTRRGDACYRWEEDGSPMDLEPPTAPALLELLAAEPIREPRESRRVDPHTGEILGRDTRHGSTSSIVRHLARAAPGDGWTHDETDPNGDAHWTRPRRKPARARRRPCTPIRTACTCSPRRSPGCQRVRRSIVTGTWCIGGTAAISRSGARSSRRRTASCAASSMMSLGWWHRRWGLQPTPW